MEEEKGDGRSFFPEWRKEGSGVGFEFVGEAPRTIYPLVQTAHLDMGVETVPPNSRIPEHSHADKEEIIFISRGNGKATVGGISREVGPGSVLYIPPAAVHCLDNVGEEPILLTWTFAPPREGFRTQLEQRVEENTCRRI
ncbi:hypothetical protein QOT17_014411 [Balamuthia mandrillaris]